MVADIKGPATITMIHFAMPGTLKLNRDVLLRIYWDGEKEPSVDCPLVDFFCDPAGRREELSTALVNKRRGWNAYFPMPFRKSARVELVYDGPLAAGREAVETDALLQLRDVPHAAEKFPDTRLFPCLLASGDVAAGPARLRGPGSEGQGQVRRLERHRAAARRADGYPVDENEKFFIDGEETASVEFQGMEDSFGFSWGFPESQSMFPLTGYYPFFHGACAYRFFLQDAISFEKSLRVAIGFGKHEDPIFGGNSVGPAAGCNSPARCIGIKPSRTPRCRRCLRPPRRAGPGRPFLA